MPFSQGHFEYMIPYLLYSLYTHRDYHIWRNNQNEATCPWWPLASRSSAAFFFFNKTSLLAFTNLQTQPKATLIYAVLTH